MGLSTVNSRRLNTITMKVKDLHKRFHTVPVLPHWSYNLELPEYQILQSRIL